MRKSEEIHKLVKQWKNLLAISALVFLIGVIGLFVMVRISKSQKITYHEVSVSVQDVNEVYVHHRRNSERKLEVKVSFQGDIFTLKGVKVDERQKYKEALESNTDIIVYEYNDELYSSVDAIRGSTVTSAFMMLFWGICVFSGASVVLSLVAYIINVSQFKNLLVKEAEEEKRDATAKRTPPPIKRPKNIPNSIKNNPLRH